MTFFGDPAYHTVLRVRLLQIKLRPHFCIHKQRRERKYDIRNNEIDSKRMHRILRNEMEKNTDTN